MAKKVILTDSDSESYICPYCDGVGTLLATIEATVVNVPIAPDDWPLGDGFVVENTLVEIVCDTCGMRWAADEVGYAEAGEVPEGEDE